MNLEMRETLALVRGTRNKTWLHPGLGSWRTKQNPGALPPKI